ncbi:hypothetical protein IMSAGC005_03031 [Lachnospiraceae bacterium]|nr:hypothetical protein IMSAGC005_03031 [Lachnospiraceae bacterium]
MSRRINELHKKSVELAEEKKSLSNQSDFLSDDLKIIKELTAELSDEEVLGSILLHERVLRLEIKQTSDAIEDNADRRQEKKQETDFYIESLEDNLSKLEQMKKASDLGKNDGFVKRIEKRIYELQEIKALLESEDGTISSNEGTSDVSTINCIWDKPAMACIDESNLASISECQHRDITLEQIRTVLKKEKLISDDRRIIRSAIMKGIIGEKEIRNRGSMVRKKYDSLIVKRKRECDYLQSKLREIARRLALNPSKQDRKGIKVEILNLKERQKQYKSKYSQQDIMKYTLQEYRNLGLSDDDQGQKYESDGGESSLIVIDAIESIRSFVPTEWVEKSNDIPITTRYMGQRGRGYFDMKDGKPIIALGGIGRQVQRCAFHEMGHFYEELFPEIRKLEHEFYNRRTSGEDLQCLGYGYRKNEVTRFDHFIDPYMGKDYGNTETSGYELLSMGMESVFMDAYDLSKDTEYQDFIFGILTSI